jgi:hypothetical protein
MAKGSVFHLSRGMFKGLCVRFNVTTNPKNILNKNAIVTTSKRLETGEESNSEMWCRPTSCNSGSEQYPA